MFLDAREIDENAELSADVCIVGAGAAGITMALRLDEASVSTLVLESGGFEYEDAVQDLYRGDVIGYPYEDPDLSRLRYFGGSTNHWGGQVRPLEAVDFERRDWVPHSGWPITRSDLLVHYERAQQLLDLPDLSAYANHEWEQTYWGPYVKDLPFDSGGIYFVKYMANAVRFGEQFREHLKRSESVRVALHANVTRIETDENGRHVSGLTVRTLTGKTLKARARSYVLAMGGMENARLLLNNAEAVPQGLGNKNGLVGRFFMDHIGSLPAARIVLRRDSLCVPKETVDDRTLNIAFSPELQEKEGALNSVFSLEIEREPSDLALTRIWEDIRGEGRFPRELPSSLGRIFVDLDDVLPAIWCYTGGSRRNYESFIMSFGGEVVPNPESRIALGDERDALGLRRIAVDLQLTERDRENTRTCLAWLGRALGASNKGRVELADWLVDSTPAPPDRKYTTTGSAHHCGTTRMSDDAASGVVDGNSRMHGVDNLYIAGSSVFPTIGYTNPTLTIIALSDRLAAHLAQAVRG